MEKGSGTGRERLEDKSRTGRAAGAVEVGDFWRRGRGPGRGAWSQALVDDGARRNIDCASHVNDKVIKYVDGLESIPIDTGVRPLRTQDRFHRLVLQQYAMGEDLQSRE